VLYRYTPDRKGEHPRKHLQPFRGILQADGYAGFARLYSDGSIVEAACLAHARRKFWDVHEATKSPLPSAGFPPAGAGGTFANFAREALNRIAALYRVEDDIRGRPPEQRLRTRTERTAPLMTALRDWLEAARSRISGRSDLAAAIRYTLSRWKALTLILRDGRACIDNSAAERAMRPIAVGRRNWTFAGSDAGGERAAASCLGISPTFAHGWISASLPEPPQQRSPRGRLERLSWNRPMLLAPASRRRQLAERPGPIFIRKPALDRAVHIAALGLGLLKLDKDVAGNALVSVDTK
jgi:transposase